MIFINTVEKLYRFKMYYQPAAIYRMATIAVTESEVATWKKVIHDGNFLRIENLYFQFNHKSLKK